MPSGDTNDYRPFRGNGSADVVLAGQGLLGDVMHFTRTSDRDDWTGKVLIRGTSVRMTIDSSHALSEHERLAQEAISRIEKAWPEIEANLLRSLHVLYNNTWAEPEEGFDPLPADEFLKRLVVDTVWVMDEEPALSLYFDDSGLFGGHTIDLFWNSDGKMYDATLAG